MWWPKKSICVKKRDLLWLALFALGARQGHKQAQEVDLHEIFVVVLLLVLLWSTNSKTTTKEMGV